MESEYCKLEIRSPELNSMISYMTAFFYLDHQEPAIFESFLQFRYFNSTGSILQILSLSPELGDPKALRIRIYYLGLISVLFLLILHSKVIEALFQVMYSRSLKYHIVKFTY